MDVGDGASVDAEEGTADDTFPLNIEAEAVTEPELIT